MAKKTYLCSIKTANGIEVKKLKVLERKENVVHVRSKGKIHVFDDKGKIKKVHFDSWETIPRLKSIESETYNTFKKKKR